MKSRPHQQPRGWWTRKTRPHCVLPAGIRYARALTQRLAVPASGGLGRTAKVRAGRTCRDLPERWLLLLRVVADLTQERPFTRSGLRDAAAQDVRGNQAAETAQPRSLSKVSLT
jgi:hypothetical protein